ncbi:MAG: hypothetical protein MR224_00800 [Dorea sp.]|nr:hypothetical protein [Dorea sp.]
MTKIAEEYGRLFELWDYNQYVAPLQLALEYKDEEESLRILEKMLEAVSERWDLKHTFLYRDIAEDISEKSEKETEKEIKKKKAAEKQMIQTLLSMIERDPQCEFLKNNEKKKRLQEKYQKKIEIL